MTIVKNVNLFDFIYGFWNDEIKRSQKELTENEYNTILSEKLEQLMEIVDTEVQVFNVDKFFMDKLHDEIRERAENYKILNVRYEDITTHKFTSYKKINL